MSYLAIDTAGARELVVTLRSVEDRVEPILRLITDAEQLADLATTTCIALDEIGDEARRTAWQIETALRVVEGFRLRLSVVVAPLDAADRSTRGAASPLWDAASDRSWNLVHQVASHNSYVAPGGIAALYDDGVRAFELDIHRGAPTDFTPGSFPLTGVQLLAAIAVDHFDHEGGRPEDWRVYHTSVGPDSQYLYLSDGLAAVTSIETSDPLTVFVDNKDAFGGTHTRAAFDQLLDETIGDRLYTPAELIARAPGATSVREAVTVAGWPTVAELEDRIMVVLTDELDGDQASARSFVAPSPQFSRDERGVVHLADDNAVFYNADARWLSRQERAALQDTASVVRTYFGLPCVIPAVDDAFVVPNYKAVDSPTSEQDCVTTSASPGG